APLDHLLGHRLPAPGRGAGNDRLVPDAERERGEPPLAVRVVRRLDGAPAVRRQPARADGRLPAAGQLHRGAASARALAGDPRLVADLPAAPRDPDAARASLVPGLRLAELRVRLRSSGLRPVDVL